MKKISGLLSRYTEASEIVRAGLDETCWRKRFDRRIKLPIHSVRRLQRNLLLENYANQCVECGWSAPKRWMAVRIEDLRKVPISSCQLRCGFRKGSRVQSSELHGHYYPQG